MKETKEEFLNRMMQRSKIFEMALNITDAFCQMNEEQLKNLESVNFKSLVEPIINEAFDQAYDQRERAKGDSDERRDKTTDQRA